MKVVNDRRCPLCTINNIIRITIITYDCSFLPLSVFKTFLPLTSIPTAVWGHWGNPSCVFLVGLRLLDWPVLSTDHLVLLRGSFGGLASIFLEWDLFWLHIFSLDNELGMCSKMSRRLQWTINWLYQGTTWVWSLRTPIQMWKAGQWRFEVICVVVKTCLERAGKRTGRDLGGEAFIGSFKLSSGSCEKNKAEENERCQRR
jgi:hypothetical protein